MMRRGVTMSLLWDEYARSAADAGPGPYMYSAFCDRHRRWREANPEVTMHMAWKPGEWTQVDWVGDTMSVADPDAGRPRRACVFVGALPSGEHAYAEGSYSMGIGPWVEAHVHMFAFFGGSTPLLAPDNLKVGVTRNDADGLVPDEQYRRMCEHYGVAVVPARVRRPRDKAGVETGVGLVERQAFAPLRDRTFLSLADPDQALWEGVARPDARPSRRREGSRESTFLGQEKPCLQPLPPEPYEMAARSRATVQSDYHVLFDGRHYSVPARLARREVEVAATGSAVATSCGGERVALHQRSYGPRGSYVTDPAHMPRAHREYAGWSGDYFRSRADGIGPSARAVLDGLLASRQAGQQSYRTCRALLSLAEREGAAALEEACSRALQLTPRPSHETVRTLLRGVSAEREADPDAQAFLRGAGYYEGVGDDE